MLITPPPLTGLASVCQLTLCAARPQKRCLARPVARWCPGRALAVARIAPKSGEGGGTTFDVMWCEKWRGWWLLVPRIRSCDGFRCEVICAHYIQTLVFALPPGFGLHHGLKKNTGLLDYCHMQIYESVKRL